MRSRSKWLAILAVLAVVAIVVAACGATPAPQIVEKVVEKTVVVTQEVEKIVEQTVEVEKIVEQTVVVEVTVAPPPGEEKVTLNALIGTEPPTIDPAVSVEVGEL